MMANVVVPLDGSAFGEQVLDVSAAIARLGQGRLHLVHTLVPIVVADALMQYTLVDIETPTEAREYLAKAVDRIQPPAPKAVAMQVLDGAVSQGIEEYAVREKADLIAMTTHGRGPVSRAWLGSVADELLHRTSIPLLLLRPKDDPPTQRGPSAFHHVLVALDGSTRAEAILGPALDLARLFHARVTLLRVIPPEPTQGLELIAQPLASSSTEHWEQHRALAQDYLAKKAQALNPQFPDIQHRVVSATHAATAIRDEARRLGCDLIAMQTHGRAGISRLFLGSVADKVVRDADCAVLVQRGSGA